MSNVSLPWSNLLFRLRVCSRIWWISGLESTIWASVDIVLSKVTGKDGVYFSRTDFSSRDKSWDLISRLVNISQEGLLRISLLPLEAWRNVYRSLLLSIFIR